MQWHRQFCSFEHTAPGSSRPAFAEGDQRWWRGDQEQPPPLLRWRQLLAEAVQISESAHTNWKQCSNAQLWYGTGFKYFFVFSFIQLICWPANSVMWGHRVRIIKQKLSCALQSSRTVPVIICVERKAAGVQGRPCASPASMSAVGGVVSATATCWMGECPTESPLKKVICCSFTSATLTNDTE